jgi:glutaconate CoA-transferase subunit B
MLRQNSRTFVEKLDFMTSAGFLDGGDTREGLGVPGRGPQAVITDLGVLEPHPESRELVLTAVHAGVSPSDAVKATGWPLQVAEVVETTKEPTVCELEALRSLRPSEGSGIREMIGSKSEPLA